PRHVRWSLADVRMIGQDSNVDRPPQSHVPDIPSILAEDMLAHVKWHTISWRTGTKESSRLALLLFACGSPTDHRSGLGTRVSNICPGSRLGSSANTGCREKRNTISPTCRQRPTCVPWRPPSRHDGLASRLTSS